MVIYDTLYELLNTYIYGSPDVLTTYQEFTLVQLSTIGSVFVCALPILAIFWLYRFVCTIGNRW